MSDYNVVLIALVAGLALVIGIAVGGFDRSQYQSAWRLRSAMFKSGIWVATFVLGATLTVVLLWLTINLTINLAGKIWHDTRPTTTASAVVPPASGASAVAAATGDGKDAVANAMTAVSIVVAIVTLVLTVGTGWIATQQKALDDKLRSADEKLARLRERDQLDEQAARVASKSVAAKRAAMGWIQRQGTHPYLLALRSLETYNELDQLATDDLESRRRSFRILASLFDWDESLAPIRDYSEECHLRARNLAWYQGKVTSRTEEAALERAGLACRIFDDQELRRMLGLSA